MFKNDYFILPIIYLYIFTFSLLLKVQTDKSYWQRAFVLARQFFSYFITFILSESFNESISTSFHCWNSLFICWLSQNGWNRKTGWHFYCFRRRDFQKKTGRSLTIEITVLTESRRDRLMAFYIVKFIWPL